MPDASVDDVGTHSRFLERTWWLHPLLLAAFPVISLFSRNIREQITLDPLLLPLAVAVAGSAVLVAVVAAVFALTGRGLARAGLVATLAIALFFSYGHVWPLVEPMFRVHRYLLIAWAVIALVSLIIILRARTAHVRAATAALNVIGLLLVAVNVVPIAQFQLAAPATVSAAPSSTVPVEAGNGPRRDIWYLVFDRYAGQDALSRIYGYDNRPFLEELERRGFTVIEHSTANYLKTAHSLASTLSLDYLDADALLADAEAPDDWTPLYRALQGSHAVERFVHERGYSYLHLGVRRGATYTNSEADLVFLYGDQTEFGAVLADTTLLVALENVLSDDAPGGLAGMYGKQSLYQLRTLEQLAAAPSETPRFIFAHLLLPHSPYLFNADGSWVTPDQAAERSRDEAYLEQLKFANARILRLLDILLAAPEDEDSPIVLIQADEGPFPDRYARDEEGFQWEEATEAELIQKFSILAAYRVPGVTADELGLHPGITPVNSLRAIFRATFGADLPALPDRNLIFTDQRHIYELVDVTDRLDVIR